MRSWLRAVVLVCALAAVATAGRAQGGPASSVKTALVVDFANRAGQAGAGLERFATDAVAVELANSGRYDLVKRTETERAARELNLRPPYDKADLQRLAKSLGADVVVTGEISFIRREKVKDSIRLRLGMKVRVMDPETGELISGASPIVVQEERKR